MVIDGEECQNEFVETTTSRAVETEGSQSANFSSVDFSSGKGLGLSG
jgi:hypothetical protein